MCEKFHQLLAVGRWFPPGTPVSSTRKLISSSSFHRLDMTLAVAEALNPNKPKPCGPNTNVCEIFSMSSIDKSNGRVHKLQTLLEHTVYLFIRPNRAPSEEKYPRAAVHTVHVDNLKMRFWHPRLVG